MDFAWIFQFIFKLPIDKKNAGLYTELVCIKVHVSFCARMKRLKMGPAGVHKLILFIRNEVKKNANI